MTGNLERFRLVSLASPLLPPITLYVSGRFDKSQSFFSDYEEKNHTLENLAIELSGYER